MAQNQVSQGGGRGGAGGNLGNLGNTLQKLNNSIVGLQKSIEMLGRNFRGASMQTGRGATPVPYLASQPMTVNQPFRNAIQIAEPTALMKDRRILELETRQRLQMRLDRIRRSLVEAEQHPENTAALDAARSEGSRMSKDLANYDARRVAWAKRYAEQKMEYNRRKAVMDSPENRQNLLFNRAAAGFVGGQIVGGIGDMLWDSNAGRSARNKTAALFSAAGQAF